MIAQTQHSAYLEFKFLRVFQYMKNSEEIKRCEHLSVPIQRL